jgi:hypothetical protein
MTDIILRPPTRHQIRAAKISSQITLEPPEQISFQHTVLCQTSMPYRNQGDNKQNLESLRRNHYAPNVMCEMHVLRPQGAKPCAPSKAIFPLMRCGPERPY